MDVRRHLLVIRVDQNAEVVSRFDLRQSLALLVQDVERDLGRYGDGDLARAPAQAFLLDRAEDRERDPFGRAYMAGAAAMLADLAGDLHQARPHPLRSEEHTSELQSLMRISYAVFCLKQKTQTQH